MQDLDIKTSFTSKPDSISHCRVLFFKLLSRFPASPYEKANRQPEILHQQKKECKLTTENPGLVEVTSFSNLAVDPKPSRPLYCPWGLLALQLHSNFKCLAALAPMAATSCRDFSSQRVCLYPCVCRSGLVSGALQKFNTSHPFNLSPPLSQRLLAESLLNPG